MVSDAIRPYSRSDDPSNPHCPVVLVHDKNIQLIWRLMSHRHAGARDSKIGGRDPGWERISGRTIRPMPDTDYPCDIDCAIVRNIKNVKLI